MGHKKKNKEKEKEKACPARRAITMMELSAA